MGMTPLIEFETEKIVSFGLTDSPTSGFLTTSFIELEKGGQVCIGVMNKRGDAYAYSRISKEDFLNAVRFITGNPDQ